MKKIFFVIIYLLISNIVSSQPIKVDKAMMQTEYNDGDLWAFYDCEGFQVYLNHSTLNEYGKYHKISIFIKNNTSDKLDFEPSKLIKAFSVGRSYEYNERVFSYDEYIKKVNNQQIWAAALYGFSVGMNSTTYHYDSYGNYIGSSYNSGLATQQCLDFGMLCEDDKERIKSNYLKRNTVYSGEAISGYVLVSRSISDKFYLSITLNGVQYDFAWQLIKRQASTLLD